MILKKHMKKLRKSKSSENLKSDAWRSVGISPFSEVNNTTKLLQKYPDGSENTEKSPFNGIDGSPWDISSNTRDARIQIFRAKILPYVPDYVKDIFERLLQKTECKDTQTEVEKKDADCQHDLRTETKLVETDLTPTLEKGMQTELELNENLTQTETIAHKDEFCQTELKVESKETEVTETELEPAKETTEASVATDEILKVEFETQTQIFCHEISVQTDGQTFDLIPAERKLEDLTKTLEQHVTLLKECAEFSAEFANNNNSSTESGVQTDQDVLEEPSPPTPDATIFLNSIQEEPSEEIKPNTWLPVWPTGNPLRQIQCGLASLIPARRSLFSPMATLMTPLGRTWFLCPCHPHVCPAPTRRNIQVFTCCVEPRTLP